MTIREQIVRFMHQWIDERGAECVIISPTALAGAAMQYFDDSALVPQTAYTSLEHYKQISRTVLAGKYQDDSEENPAYAEQGSLFSGRLQDRYPLPRVKGREPQYKLRSLLTIKERAWNVSQLRKSADARLAHADSLEAEGRDERGEEAS